MTWLCLAVCLSGFSMVAVGWWRQAHLTDVMARGTKAVAVIDHARIRNGALIVPSVEIRYLPNDAGALPVIVANADEQSAGAYQLQMWGLIFAALGALGGAFLVGVLPRIGTR